MSLEYKHIYPGVSHRIKSDVFNHVTTRLTRTQEKSMRVLDYNITDLRYELRDHIE